MIKFDDLPLDLVFKIWDLKFNVKVADDPAEVEVLDSNKWAGYINPGAELIVVSGSCETRHIPQVLAHELGHAEQFREGVYYTGNDQIRYFQHEMDAVQRGEKHVGDMRANYDANYYGYAESLGVIHLGRS